jgi:hypothetical protein
VASQIKTGDESRIQQDLTNIRGAAEQFLADVRRYPKNVGQLVKKPVTTTSDTSLVGGVFTAAQILRWRGPYINKDSVTTLSTGFDSKIDALFTNTTVASQAYLTITIAALDTGSARLIDRRMDDGDNTNGVIQWTTVAATTTLKFYALPIQ